jgi:ubiquinone/menaquinone biosynthesis C-methylase UbiE
MESRTTPEEEMARAAALPQADATSFVEAERLESAVKDMYRHVAREDEAELHFKVGRGVAADLGYDPAILDRVPAAALASFAGVGHHFDLARLAPGETVLDLGSGSGTDVFYAALQVGAEGRAVGIDFTDEQSEKANRLREEAGFANVEFVEGQIEDLPFAAESFDAVISNGVINLSIRKNRVFEEVARVLRPRGRFAVADIVSGKALKERTRRNVDLWAACVAGAIPRANYVEAIETAGMSVREAHENNYEFISERALEACGTYEIESVSLLAVKD